MTNLAPHRPRPDQGYIILALIILVTTSLFVGLALGKWINIRQRGNMSIRVSIKESALGQTALEEARYRMMTDPTLATCTPGQTRSFTFSIDRSTITVNVECFTF